MTRLTPSCLARSDVKASSASLFAPGYTLASVIANEFTEATTDLYLSSLFELGLVLLAVTILVNVVAQLMLRSLAGSGTGKIN